MTPHTPPLSCAEFGTRWKACVSEKLTLKLQMGFCSVCLVVVTSPALFLLTLLRGYVPDLGTHHDSRHYRAAHSSTVTPSFSLAFHTYPRTRQDRLSENARSRLEPLSKAAVPHFSFWRIVFLASEVGYWECEMHMHTMYSGMFLG
jgi:hypothetical protein